VSKTSRRNTQHEARRENSKARVTVSSLLRLVFDTAAVRLPNSSFRVVGSDSGIPTFSPTFLCRLSTCLDIDAKVTSRHF
jgi:hypothetical protein